MKYRAHLQMMALTAALFVAAAGCAAGSDSSEPAASSVPVVVESEEVPAEPSTEPAADPVIWAIGDSLMVGAQDRLVEAWPAMLIDAQVGRSFESGIDVLERLLSTGTPDIVVFALGTNNGATTEQAERVMLLASDADEVVFVNVSVPRPWESATNAALQETVSDYPNAALVDWKTASQSGVGMFRADGYHLTADGIDAWVDMIMAAVNR